MFVDDLFDKKTLTENRGGGSPWHSEPEQQQMDVNRRGGLERERNAGLDEPDEVASDSVSTGNGVYEYTVPAGQEDIAQELGLQQHRGHWVSRVPVQRANFQFGRPQFHEIPSQGVAEGMLDNPGAQDSPVASAIIRRILLQRTDLLSKYGPEKVGAAVDEVADFVGDVEEIGSSDVSGWIRHVEQMLGNMSEGVAEGTQVNELFGFGQDLQKQIAKKEDELKALKAKLASKTATNAGIQTGATALIDPDTGEPYEKDKLASLYGYKEPNTSTPVAPSPYGKGDPEQTKATVAKMSNEKLQSFISRATDPANPHVQIAKAELAKRQASGATGAAKTPAVDVNPAGFNAGNVMKLPGMEKYAKPTPAPKTANFGGGPTGYGKTTTSIKPPAAPSSPALAVPKVPAAPRVTSGGPTPAEKAALDKRIAAAAAAPAVAETLAQVERMLESVNSKKSAEMVQAYVDQRFTELGLRNTTECRNLMARVVQESAIRRRQHAKSLAK